MSFQNQTAQLGMYLMISVVLSRLLFDTRSDIENHFSKEVTNLKNDLNTQIEKFDEVNK